MICTSIPKQLQRFINHMKNLSRNEENMNLFLLMSKYIMKCLNSFKESDDSNEPTKKVENKDLQQIFYSLEEIVKKRAGDDTYKSLTSGKLKTMGNEEYSFMLENIFTNVNNEDLYDTITMKTVAKFRLMADLIEVREYFWEDKSSEEWSNLST